MLALRPLLLIATRPWPQAFASRVGAETKVLAGAGDFSDYTGIPLRPECALEVSIPPTRSECLWHSHLPNISCCA